MTDAHLDPDRRHDAVILFDVTDGNPNGDPDGGNAPRTDDETGHGIVTDVAIKRRIRDTVALLRGDDARYGIFVEAGHALNTRIEEALQAQPGRPEDAQRWLCEHYFDIRMFGAVLTAGKGRPPARVHGPVQVSFARSLDPVYPIDHTITRVTQTRQEDIDKGEQIEMGSRWTVPYGLYRGCLLYSPPRGRKTGVTSDDLAMLWRSLELMFELGRSASSGVMGLCGLYVYSHDSPYGLAPWRALDGRIRVERRSDTPPRRHTDYQRTIADTDLPTGVTLTRLVDVWA